MLQWNGKLSALKSLKRQNENRKEKNVKSQNEKKNINDYNGMEKKQQWVLFKAKQVSNSF